MTVDGVPVELTATEYAVLLQRVWGPERVGEAWLVRNVVKLLRRKLGDDAEDPRYIITEPRVGYRMVRGDGTETEDS